MSTEKYVNAIQFLSSRLSCKINRFHSVRVGREVVQNVLVLNREQHSLYGLFDQYKDTYPDNARLGRNNFCEVVQLLSQKSEVMAGLSIYLVDFLYISKYIREVLARYSELIDMDTVLSAESNILGPKSAQLLERWEELFVFLRLRYGNFHVGEDIASPNHSCRFILEKGCAISEGGTEHWHACRSCDDIFLFSISLQGFLELIEGKLLHSKDLQGEVSTMINSVKTISEEITRYAAHEVRGVHQENAIKKVKLDIRKSAETILLVCDHKKKVFPTFFSRGAVAVFLQNMVLVFWVYWRFTRDVIIITILSSMGMYLKILCRYRLQFF